MKRIVIITLDINLAKNVSAVHGVNDTGKVEHVKVKVPRLTDSYCRVLPITLPGVAISWLMCNGGKGCTAANEECARIQSAMGSHARHRGS